MNLFHSENLMPNDTKYLGNNKQLVKVGALCIKKGSVLF